jgi:hypothetical protein
VWPPFFSPAPLVAPQLLYDPIPDLLVTASLFATLYMFSSWADQTGGMCGPGLHHPLSNLQEEIKSSFWIIAEAVKRFHQKHGGLPVAGGLPDMKAQSAVYIQLQNIYKDKAREDAAEVLATVRRTPGGENVDPSEVEQFCTNARFIKLIRDANGGETPLDQLVGTFMSVAV